MRQEKELKKFWSPFRVASTLVVLTLVAMFGFASCNSTEVKPPKTVANALPENVLQAEMRSTNGSSIKLADYPGKVLFVNLWATWCGPCRVEIPELVQLYKEFQPRGVEMFGLSTENPETSAELVRAFVRDYSINYHVGWVPHDVAGTLMQGRTSIPQSFIISRDGRILKRFIGFNRDLTPPQLRQALEEALAEKG